MKKIRIWIAAAAAGLCIALGVGLLIYDANSPASFTRANVDEIRMSRIGKKGSDLSQEEIGEFLEGNLEEIVQTVAASLDGVEKDSIRVSAKGYRYLRITRSGNYLQMDQLWLPVTADGRMVGEVMLYRGRNGIACQLDLDPRPERFYDKMGRMLAEGSEEETYALLWVDLMRKFAVTEDNRIIELQGKRENLFEDGKKENRYFRTEYNTITASDLTDAK